MSQSATVFTDYYTQQNELARRFYFTQIKYHKEKHIEFANQNGVKTPLYFRYSPEGIKARLDAIRLIGAFGNKLAVMAGADSPQRISDTSAGILASVSGLDQEFRKLTGVEALHKDEFAQGSSQLVSAITKMYAEKIQQDALKAAIQNGHAAVETILVALQADLKDLSFKNQGMFSTQLSDLAYLYNQGVDARIAAQESKTPMKGPAAAQTSPQFTDTQLLDILGQAQATAALYEGSVSQRPDEVIAAMRKANDDLYEFSMHPKGDNALVALNASLESFNARIKPFVDYYVANRK
ncbi:hypothetical protein DNK59_25310 [Pseudomonas sp. TKO26]|nr:hypothetical protein DNK62_25310 [Pseudomonas sp. TKO30]PYY81513.1 hypothetical protein DNK61_24685 [Pseudomonas sp. TKO29]PYY83357.1 hypothetical protein DNK59_25310 [Pseudomonas sp. TKO26]PYY97477.1 hypothetical protein DNK60_26160 [Pseudomonas sp. TKO14]